MGALDRDRRGDAVPDVSDQILFGQLSGREELFQFFEGLVVPVRDVLGREGEFHGHGLAAAVLDVSDDVSRGRAGSQALWEEEFEVQDAAYGTEFGATKRDAVLVNVSGEVHATSRFGLVDYVDPYGQSQVPFSSIHEAPPGVSVEKFHFGQIG